MNVRLPGKPPDVENVALGQ